MLESSFLTTIDDFISVKSTWNITATKVHLLHIYRDCEPIRPSNMVICEHFYLHVLIDACMYVTRLLSLVYEYVKAVND